MTNRFFMKANPYKYSLEWKICFEYKLYSIEMQSHGKFGVFIELPSRSDNLVSLKCIPIDSLNL